MLILFRRGMGNFSILKCLYKGDKSAMRPRTLTSIVITLTWCLENGGFKKLLMDSYLVNFLLRDCEKLVSWQTVNSITEMQLFFRSTKSGLNEWKTVATGGFSGRSANTEWEERIDEMWSTKIVRISLCLFVYLERRPGDEQFESTCLLVWIWLQSEHRFEVALPHLPYVQRWQIVVVLPSWQI